MRKILAMISAFVFSSSFGFGATPPPGLEDINLNGNPVIVDPEPDRIGLNSLEIEFVSQGVSPDIVLRGGIILGPQGGTFFYLESPVNIKYIKISNLDTGYTSTEWVNSTTVSLCNLFTNFDTPGLWEIEIVTASNVHLLSHFYIDESGRLMPPGLGRLHYYRHIVTKKGGRF